MRRVSLGAGYRYLIESSRSATAPLCARQPRRLLRGDRTPPGRFLGSGLAGSATAGYPGGQRGDRGLPVPDARYVLRSALRQAGRRLPNTGSKLAAVAGFDLTFSPPKSVSTLWALANPATRQAIYDCHRHAIDIVLDYAERMCSPPGRGRTGSSPKPIDGVIATAFTHFDSRAGDPQLHDHVIIWNRARSTSDGKWRTLDSKAIFQSRSALSSLHQGVLADLLTQQLGVDWEARASRYSQRGRWEIAGVPEALLKLFSTRSGQIDTAKDDLIEQFKKTTDADRPRWRSSGSARPPPSPHAPQGASQPRRDDRHLAATSLPSRQRLAEQHDRHRTGPDASGGRCERTPTPADAAN